MISDSEIAEDAAEANRRSGGNIQEAILKPDDPASRERRRAARICRVLAEASDLGGAATEDVLELAAKLIEANE